jgi:hypothetical protein
MPLVINPSARRRKIDVTALFKKAGVKANPHRNRKRSAVKARSRRQWKPGKSLKANRGHRKTRKSGRKASRKMARNAKRSFKMNRKGRKAKNPLVVNPLVVNPKGDLVGGLTRPIAGILGKMPVIGKRILSPAVLLLGSAVAGAIGTTALHYAMSYLDEYVPDMVKPVGYTLAGSLGGAVVLQLPKFPMQNAIAVAMPVAGAAIDVYRWFKGASDQLGELGAYGAADMPDAGDPFSSYEYQDASLKDADHCISDLDDEECKFAALGRRAWWSRYWVRMEARPGVHSYHAGRPGSRFGWLIYILGFDNFRALAAMPPDQRRAYLEQFRIKAQTLATEMIAAGRSPDVQSAATAGLLTTFAQ